MVPEQTQDDSHKALGKMNKPQKQMFQKFDVRVVADVLFLLLVQNHVY